MKVEINTKIKVFPKLYVGLKAQTLYDRETQKHTPRIHLGFATPLENNAAFEKRKKTVDSWAVPFGEWDPVTRKTLPAKKVDPITVDNVAVPGFKITDDVRRVYWGGGNVVWRVEDPRGYELEISSQNLMAIIQMVGLKPGGEIPGKCVWARDGANNVLLHETTQEFKNAYRVGETISSKGTKLLPEHLGCKVSFKSGYTGTYLGAGSSFSWSVYGYNKEFRESYNHYFLNADGKSLTAYRDPKPLLIEDGQPLTDAAALKIINRLRNDTFYAGYNGAFGLKYTQINRAKKAKRLTLTLPPIPIEEAMKQLQMSANWANANVVSMSPTIILGKIDDQLFSLTTDQFRTNRPLYGSQQPTFKMYFNPVQVKGRMVEEISGTTAQVVIPGLPKDADNPALHKWGKEVLPQILRSFDSLVIVQPIIEY